MMEQELSWHKYCDLLEVNHTQGLIINDQLQKIKTDWIVDQAVEKEREKAEWLVNREGY